MRSVLGQPHFRLPSSCVMTQLSEPSLPAAAHADGLGGVDDAAAADGQQEIYPLCPGKINAFIHLTTAGIGLNTP